MTQTYSVMPQLVPHTSLKLDLQKLESAPRFDSFFSFILNATAGLTPTTAMCSAGRP